MRICVSTVAGFALLAGSAAAATPEAGRVTSAQPRVEWTGMTSASWLFGSMVTAFDAPCEAPGCDSFALDVVEPGDLTIGLGATPGARLTARVRQPDGFSTNFAEQAGPDGFVRLAFESAATGAWAVDYTGGPDEYTGFAELTTAGIPVGEIPSTPGVPKALELGVTVRRASARRLARSRRLLVAIDLSAPASVRATLKAGRKVVGRGSAKGPGPMTVRLRRRLGRGVYALLVVATAGRTSTAKIVKVKVVR